MSEMFKYICRIEQKLRLLISYEFSETYSPNETEYLNAANYNNTHKNAAGIHKLIQMLTIEARLNTNHLYVVYQRTTYILSYKLVYKARLAELSMV